MEKISVVIPLGPDPQYKEFLSECVESITNQSYLPDEIIFIDDGMHISIPDIYHLFRECGNGSDYYNQGYYNNLSILDRSGTSLTPFYELPTWKMGGVFVSRFGGCNQNWEPGPLIGLEERITIKYYRTWWNVGVADAFNFGVSISSNELVFMIGSDDKMLPTCLERCVKAYDEKKQDGWYGVTYQVQSGEVCSIANNTCMVTKALWKELGGFPPSAGVGACDALLLSIMLKHMPERIFHVPSDGPLCWLREGDYQDTRKNGWLYANEIVSIRNKETLRWKPFQ